MTTPTPLVFTAEEFHKASLSDPDQSCVMIARRDGVVEVRDDKLKDTPYYELLALRLSEVEFDVFQTAVRDGEAITTRPELLVSQGENGLYTFGVANSETMLVFDQSEIDAFCDGIAKREFDALVSA